MPLTEKGRKILRALEKTYSSKRKAESVLYAGKNKGTFTGIDGQAMRARLRRAFDALLDRHLKKS